jgi:hypothetical protein
MKFCTHCHNMLYLKVAPADQTRPTPDLIYYCKNCAFQYAETPERLGYSIVENTTLRASAGGAGSGGGGGGGGGGSDALAFLRHAFPYLRHDPTLPRVNNIRCANAACAADASRTPEVIYLKVDPMNMKYMYVCCHCDAVWSGARMVEGA